MIRHVITDTVFNAAADSIRSANINLSNTVDNVATSVVHRMIVQKPLAKYVTDRMDAQEFIDALAFIAGRSIARGASTYVLDGKDSWKKSMRDEVITSILIYLGENLVDPFEINGPMSHGRQWK